MIPILNTFHLEFFITTKAAPWCDGKYVAFGEIVSGLEVVHLLQTCPTTPSLHHPLKPIIIERCGIL
jgi:cyclophilin family peptidyl-prolyl cis-trans isomerase